MSSRCVCASVSCERSVGVIYQGRIVGGCGVGTMDDSECASLLDEECFFGVDEGR